VVRFKHPARGEPGHLLLVMTFSHILCLVCRTK